MKQPKKQEKNRIRTKKHMHYEQHVSQPKKKDYQNPPMKTAEIEVN